MDRTRDQNPEACLSPKSMNTTLTVFDSSPIVASSWDHFSLHLLENMPIAQGLTQRYPPLRSPPWTMSPSGTSPVVTVGQDMRKPEDTSSVTGHEY